MSHMYLLFQDLEKSGNEDKIKILQSLGHLLSSNFEMKDEFHKLGGVSVILKYLDKDDWKIAGNAFHILGFSILQRKELQMQLTTQHMFKTILKHLEQGTVNHKRGSMFLIASIVEGNVPGQILARESGCLYQLIWLFHEVIQQNTKEEEKSQCLYFLCTAIKMCVHNPQNCENQHQTSLIIPKAITFLDNWFHEAFNSYLTECVDTMVPMLVNIILDNPTNQLSFSTYSGIQTLVIGLNTLESWQEAPLNIETVKVKIICLLDAAICGNIVNSEQATVLGVIPLLLKMLQNFTDQAIRRAYCFNRKRTPKDLYLKWRSTFIISDTGFKFHRCQEVVTQDNLLSIN
ncbi:telomere repeats-binding bouquet formation protein 1-like isoform X2 [Zootermopsis nevadensis]|uniref:telomere repeats-binding bouquet formation protein 1-like isoform X2 n=1 Tax=Zootermopsis nevadensis TaxID=136037 RepID=UPI000B8E9A84|nr:telomere repeats-binding bouquet formation protein 1-like isoform X2 [Zootermopsis nevadensis]